MYCCCCSLYCWFRHRRCGSRCCPLCQAKEGQEQQEQRHDIQIDLQKHPAWADVDAAHRLYSAEPFACTANTILHIAVSLLHTAPVRKSKTPEFMFLESHSVRAEIFLCPALEPRLTCANLVPSQTPVGSYPLHLCAADVVHMRGELHASTRLYSCVDIVIRVDRQVAPAHELLQVEQEVRREQEGPRAADDHPEDVVLDEAPKQDAQHQHKAARPQEASCATQSINHARISGRQDCPSEADGPLGTNSPVQCSTRGRYSADPCSCGAWTGTWEPSQLPHEQGSAAGRYTMVADHS